MDLLERPAPAEAGPGTGNGGVPARRAMVRWAWRLFRREWRQQFLILALIIVAVAATVVGAAVATDAPAPAKAGFGTAGALATFQGSGTQANAPLPATQANADIARVQHRFGQVDVIENETFAVPGSIDTYSLRAQNPHGPFGQPMLSLVSGHYPSGPGQVALTEGLASTFNVRAGDTWHGAGQSWQVVGIVQNPQSLLDEFALVAPGQVTSPNQVTVLFNPHGADVLALGHNYQTPQSVSSSNVFNPETIVFAVATVGMLLIALVAVGGFTVLAQRRLRRSGCSELWGHGPEHQTGRAGERRCRRCRRYVRGGRVGPGGMAALPAARRVELPPPDRRVRPAVGCDHPVHGGGHRGHVLGRLAAGPVDHQGAHRDCSLGRPAPPRQIRRSAVPGVLILVLSFLLLTYAGSVQGGGGMPEVVFGLISLIVALIMLSPLSLSALAD